MQVLLVLVAGALVSTVAGKDLVQYVLATNGYDFLPYTNYTELCDKCEGNLNYVNHMYNCRLMVNCVKVSGTAIILECSQETDMWGGPSYCTNGARPYKVNCRFDEQNNPCAQNKIMVADGKTCNDYYKCDDSGLKLVKMSCPDGERFDYANQACVADVTCNAPVKIAIPVRINATCGEVNGYPDKYSLTEFTSYDNKVRKNVYELACPASMIYDPSLAGTEFCCNAAEKVATADCVPNNLVRGSSLDGSWQEAIFGHEQMEFSKIEGDAVIVADGSNQFNGWAYFDGLTSFSARKMAMNELRNYWKLSFDFQAGRIDASGSVSVGIQQTSITNDANPKVALIDNSVCDIDPTYGCHIMIQGLNLGYVECFCNAHQVRTSSLDLTRTYSVVLERQTLQGTMTVTSPGSQPIIKTFSFEDGELVAGRDCSMTIAKGANQRSFEGFMNEVMFWKNCP